MTLPIESQFWSRESLYRFHERLGLLCGPVEPTTEQIQIARREAQDHHMKEITRKATK